MKIDKLSSDILILLENEGKQTQAEMKRKLYPDYKKIYDAEDTFKQLIYRRVHCLLEWDLIKEILEKGKIYYGLKLNAKELAMKRLNTNYWKYMVNATSKIIQHNNPRFFTAYFHQMDFLLSYFIMSKIEYYFTQLHRGKISAEEGKKWFDAYVDASFFQYRELLDQFMERLMKFNDEGEDLKDNLKMAINHYEKDHVLIDKHFKTTWEKIRLKLKL